MLNETKLKEYLIQYKQIFSSRWNDEKYKWEAVKCFQDNWDESASDFADMLDRSLSETGNLLVSRHNFPRKMITDFAKSAPDEAKEMFIALFDERKDVSERIEAFKTQSDILFEEYTKDGSHHFQYENAISTYLWLRYPNKYYIYKLGVLIAVAKELNASYIFKKGAYEANVRNLLQFYDEINQHLIADEELTSLFHSYISDSCYPDPDLKTLTIDFGYYISKLKNPSAPENELDDENDDEEENPNSSTRDEFPKAQVETELSTGAPKQEQATTPRNYWWLNASPKIWRFSDFAIGGVQSYTLLNENGNQRRIHQNFLDAKVGDIVIGYESTPIKKIVAIARIAAEQDEEKLQIEKTESLASPIDYSALKDYPELKDMEFFRNPQGSLFKLTEQEYNCILDIIREENPTSPKTPFDTYTKDDFLEEVYINDELYDNLVTVLRSKKNIILQGAPGVGKTFAAERLAWSMMGEKDNSRIEFIQFHQNYSYEDFVMGYKPADNGFYLKEGVFKQFRKTAVDQPNKEFFFIIDEINRGNLSKIFGELLMLIENNYRGDKHKMTLSYGEPQFYVPENLYIIGMMNTADRSLAMIDYALRRRFSFFEIEPGFDSEGFKTYQKSLDNERLNKLISTIKELNDAIAKDSSLGKGFCIGHSYFCGRKDKNDCSEKWLRSIVDYDILPMLREYWFDNPNELQDWENKLQSVFQ